MSKVLDVVDIIIFHNNWCLSWDKEVKFISDNLIIISSKWDINKFSRNNTFRLWKVNMQVILTPQNCVKALKLRH